MFIEEYFISERVHTTHWYGVFLWVGALYWAGGVILGTEKMTDTSNDDTEAFYNDGDNDDFVR